MSYTFSLGLSLPSAPNSSAIVDNTGGTASNTLTLAAITAGGSYSQTDIQALRNCVSTLAIHIDSIRTELVNNKLIQGS